jgi:hypothetical protein
VVVPAGARNLAQAAARAAATGDWNGIPLTDRSSAGAVRTPEGSVVGDISVTDPAVTGNSVYLFGATIRHGPGEPPYRIKITVERTQSGYVATPPEHANHP